MLVLLCYVFGRIEWCCVTAFESLVYSVFLLSSLSFSPFFSHPNYLSFFPCSIQGDGIGKRLAIPPVASLTVSFLRLKKSKPSLLYQRTNKEKSEARRLKREQEGPKVCCRHREPLSCSFSFPFPFSLDPKKKKTFKLSLSSSQDLSLLPFAPPFLSSKKRNRFLKALHGNIHFLSSSVFFLILGENENENETVWKGHKEGSLVRGVQTNSRKEEK